MCVCVHARTYTHTRARTHTHTIKFIQRSLDETAQFTALRRATYRTTFHNCGTWGLTVRQYAVYIATRTDRHRYRRTVAFRNFANAPKKTQTVLFSLQNIRHTHMLIMQISSHCLKTGELCLSMGMRYAQH